MILIIKTNYSYSYKTQIKLLFINFILVAILPSNFFAKKIVKELRKKNEDVILITTSLRDFRFKKKIKSHNVIHFIGSPTVTIIGILALTRFKVWRKKIIVSWIGFDVRRVKHNIFWRLTTKIFKNLIDVNITEDEEAVNNLRKANVIAEIKQPPIYSIYNIHDLPKEKKIAVYLPDKLKKDFDLYQGNLIKKLIEEFPHVDFIITRNSGRYFSSRKNVECIKWAENMEDIYKQVLAVIRLPIEDTTGVTIIETLSMGRTMIASATTFPYCKIVKNYEDLKLHLIEVLQNPTLNTKGSEYVHKIYDNDKFTNELITIYNNLSKS